MRSQYNSRRVFDVVIGQGLLQSNETAAAGFRLHCGVVRLLSNNRTDYGRNTYATAGLRCFPFLSSIHHNDTSCAVEGSWP